MMFNIIKRQWEFGNIAEIYEVNTARYGKWQNVMASDRKLYKREDDFKVTCKYAKRQENIYLLYKIWK